MKSNISILIFLFLFNSNALSSNKALIEKHNYCYENIFGKIQINSEKKTHELLTLCFTDQGMKDFVVTFLVGAAFLEDEKYKKLNNEFDIKQNIDDDKKIHGWLKEINTAKFFKDFLFLWFDGEGVSYPEVLEVKGNEIHVSYDALKSKEQTWEVYSYKSTKFGWKIDAYK